MTNIELKKISEFEWEIPKTGKMLVPVKIFASDKLIEKMKEDQTFLQAANTAELKGIVKNMIVCPDGHMGYGLPIGGVAAFDYENGIITPGGVGFDINCLNGDSKILTEFGSFMKIEDFEKIKTEIEIEQNDQKIKKILFNLSLPTLDLKNKRQENKPINLYMCKESEEVYEIELDSGLKIKATSEHPFLTKCGMKRLDSLKEEEELAVELFSGVEFEGNINKKIAIVTKILGYMFGDGTSYKSKGRLYAVAYGTPEDLETMKRDLEEINIKSKIYSRQRDHRIITRYGLVKFNAKNYELHFNSQDFIKLLIKLGMPLGNKTRQEIEIPKWIKKSNKLIKRLFLAGFFGAELSSPKSMSKTCFYCATIDQNKIELLKDNMRKFLIDISLMLEEFGVNISKISEMDDFHNKYGENTIRFRLLIAGEENLLKLWRTIGFEYNRKRKNLANIASLYIFLKRQENNRRQEIAKKIKEYKNKGFKIGEIKNIFLNKINKRFIERHFYENASQRIALDFISFDEFCNKKTEEINNFGVIFDKINKINKIDGKLKVYDFNIQDNHNFIANGFVVSNCGIRVLATNLTKKDILSKKKDIIHQISRDVPKGTGKGSVVNLDKKEIKEILETGARWAVKNGYGTKEDLEKTEDYGCLPGGNAKDVSERALARGLPQLGSLGSGNHFLEIQEVDEIYDKEIAEKFGIIKKGQITVAIHCGSRGLGHQVASDYIKLMEDEYGFEGLPDRELINAPINSELGKKYFSAMNCAANFAFCNRQMIMEWVRNSFRIFFPKAELKLIYDVCHNIAKIEEHNVDGKKMKLCVHRKGATRSFGPGRTELPKIYQKTGQPVLLPGSMGTASYILVGTKEAEEISFASTAHGAGRVSSRSAALRNIRGEDLKKELAEKGIDVEAGSWKGLVEEAPQVYKDIDEVARVSDKVGIGKLVARVIPIAVMKG